MRALNALGTIAGFTAIIVMMTVAGALLTAAVHKVLV